MNISARIADERVLDVHCDEHRLTAHVHQLEVISCAGVVADSPLSRG